MTRPCFVIASRCYPVPVSRCRAARLLSTTRSGERRESESVQHEPIVPGFSATAYTGTLSEIVREAKRVDRRYRWMPTVPDEADDVPPFALPDLLELRRLLSDDSPERRARQIQWIPRPQQVPSLPTFVDLVTRQRETLPDAGRNTALSQLIAQLTETDLAELERLRLEAPRLLAELGYAQDGSASTAEPWVQRAVRDHLIGRNTGIWATVTRIREEPGRLLSQLQAQGMSYVVDVDLGTSADLGTTRGALESGKALAQYLREGGRIKKRFPHPAQRQALTFLSIVRVNGRAPGTMEHVVAGIERLEAEVATLQLAAAWTDCGVEVPIDRLMITLSDLADRSQTLGRIHLLAGLHARVTTILLPSRLDRFALRRPGADAGARPGPSCHPK